uniref:Secreted protein n=1 Tax=Timema tahoe TaxID=61484 RepID=A0A7R9IB63_9NEOP|nr:unnamed protein product [Timema tahoe]
MLFVSLILMMPRSAESYDQRHRQVNDLQGRNPPTVKRSTPEELSNNISTTASLDQRHPSVGGPHGFHYGKKGFLVMLVPYFFKNLPICLRSAVVKLGFK